MNAQIGDDITASSSNKNRAYTGQFFAQIVAGLFGGIAGCSMIGKSVINV